MRLMKNSNAWSSISITFIKGSIINFFATLIISFLFIMIINKTSIYYWIKILLLIVISVAIIESFIKMILSKLIYKSIKYRKNETFLIYRKGVIFKREILIPFNKIYQIKIKKGPILRFLNVRSLELITAVSSLNIEYIEYKDAKKIEHHIKNHLLKGDDFIE